MRNETIGFDVLKKIEEERIRRGWSEYTLAKNSGIAQSTISSWYRKNLQPTIPSLEKICSGLGITLAQFFSDDSPLSSEQQELFSQWSRLSPEQRNSLLSLLHTI